MSELTTFQQDIGEWGEATFPNATQESIIAHLRDEAKEIPQCGCHACKWDIAEEVADCFMLLLHLAHRNGFDLLDAARKKFEINKQRMWTTDSGNGYIKHDTQQQPTTGAGTMTEQRG